MLKSNDLGYLCFKLKMLTDIDEHQEWAGSVVSKYAEQLKTHTHTTKTNEWLSQNFNLGIDWKLAKRNLTNSYDKGIWAW